MLAGDEPEAKAIALRGVLCLVRLQIIPQVFREGVLGIDDTFVVMLSERRVKTKVKALATKISKDYKGTVPVFIGILNGSFIFVADLIREVTIDCEIDLRPGGKWRLRNVKGEIYVACAETDPYAPPDMVEAVRTELASNGKGEVEIYPGTEHGFAFPQRPAYDKAAAERHWVRLHALFARNL